uniref:Uncharacterized protein n=1 Tax=Molossus molossus TaxID=27622 RepID=A0A7J8J0U9_MOLMO|nr:hypothetical protein HJG59_010403 [Molossus molossus]
MFEEGTEINDGREWDSRSGIYATSRTSVALESFGERLVLLFGNTETFKTIVSSYSVPHTKLGIFNLIHPQSDPKGGSPGRRCLGDSAAETAPGLPRRRGGSHVVQRPAEKRKEHARPLAAASVGGGGSCVKGLHALAATSPSSHDRLLDIMAAAVVHRWG